MRLVLAVVQCVGLCEQLPLDALVHCTRTGSPRDTVSPSKIITVNAPLVTNVPACDLETWTSLAECMAADQGVYWQVGCTRGVWVDATGCRAVLTHTPIRRKPFVLNAKPPAHGTLQEYQFTAFVIPNEAGVDTCTGFAGIVRASFTGVAVCTGFDFLELRHWCTLSMWSLDLCRRCPPVGSSFGRRTHK